MELAENSLGGGGLGFLEDHPGGGPLASYQNAISYDMAFSHAVFDGPEKSGRTEG
jgi:hypothetical protein